MVKEERDDVKKAIRRVKVLLLRYFRNMQKYVFRQIALEVA